MEPIDDHVEMLTLVLCKSIHNYSLENPSMVHSEMLKALSSTMFAVSGAIDDWYSQIEAIVGTKVTEECECPDFTDFLHFSNDLQDNLEGNEYEDDGDDEDDDDY